MRKSGHTKRDRAEAQRDVDVNEPRHKILDQLGEHFAAGYLERAEAAPITKKLCTHSGR